EGLAIARMENSQCLPESVHGPSLATLITPLTTRRRGSMARSSSLFPKLAGALVLSTTLSVPAAASTITVTGGDPGEGYAPLPITFAALNLGSAAVFTVQGVTFGASDPRISLSSVTTSNENVASLGASANDLALLSVVQSSVGNLGPITVTITGL